MAQPIQVQLISDDEDDHNFNKTLITPISNNLKRPRTQFQTNSPPLLIIDDDPTPQKLRTSGLSFTPSIVPETPFSDLPKITNRPVFRCTGKDNPNSISGSPSKLSGVGGLICLESDDEAEGGLERGNGCKKIGTSSGFDEGSDWEKSPKFGVEDKKWEIKKRSADFVSESCLEKSSRGIDTTFDLDKVVQSVVQDATESGRMMGSLLNNRESFYDFDVEEDLKKSPTLIANKNWWENERIDADSDLECSKNSLTDVPSTCHFGNVECTKVHESIYVEDDSDQILPFHHHAEEKGGLEEKDASSKSNSRGKANTQKKQNKNEQVANKKRSQEGKKRLMEEKKLQKEQERLHKETLEAEAAKSRQLQKDKQRWEKEAEKNILADIDTKVALSGKIGGPLLTRFADKNVKYNIASNPFEKSIVWRLTAPEEFSQLSSIRTDIRYVLLIYDAEEFCQVASDGSLFDRISSVRTRYPSYTICCLTNRLMSYISKRDQDKYKNKKDASDWQRPPVEEVFAKLTTQFANVRTRQCADEVEVAEHVVGLTINLAKCRFRKKLSPLSVNANGCNIPKDCVDRNLIMKNTWLKALVSIPKVQPRFAIAIFKKYPTLKSLLSVYMDSTKSVHEKEFLLKDLTTEGVLGNEDRRVGEICSKRVYRILMAQNGSIKTDDAENGADYFTTR